MNAPARIDELYGECQEGNGCRSTRKLKIVKWPVKNSSCVGPNINADKCFKRDYVVFQTKTHDFKNRLVSQAVILNRVGYLSAVSGPTLSPDSICQGGRMQFGVRLPLLKYPILFKIRLTILLVFKRYAENKL